MTEANEPSSEPSEEPATNWAALSERLEGSFASQPTFQGSQYSRTDWGNVQRLALYEGIDLKYAHDEDVWYRWDGKRWAVASSGELVAACIRTVNKIREETVHLDDAEERGRHSQFHEHSQSSRALNSMTSVARGNPDLWTSRTKFNSITELWNAPNCTFNPRTLEWHAHRRDDWITQLCATPYDPGASSPLLDSYLETFLPDEYERAYVVEVMSVATLSPSNLARKLLLLIGPTSTGKSTLSELLLKTLGPDYAASVNASVFRSNLEDKPRPDLMRIAPTRLALAFEASDRWDLHPDHIKRMTGGDPMVFRSMNSNIMHEVVARYTPMIVANVPPSIRGSDAALRARLLTVLMDTSSPTNDGLARDRLVNDPGAKAALLALMVRTYAACDGKYSVLPPKRFDELAMEIFAALDDVDEILNSFKEDGTLVPADVTTHPNHCARTSELYRLYHHYLTARGTPQAKREMLGPKQFGQRLLSLGYEIRRSDGMRTMGWVLGQTATAAVIRLGG